MPTFVHVADGSKTVFNCSSSALPKTTRVNGTVVAPFASNNGSVTFAAPPASGTLVEIIYGPLNGADPTIPFGSAGYVLRAIENGFKSPITPVVRYWGVGADAGAFTLDPNAQHMDVQAVGASTQVFTSY